MASKKRSSKSKSSRRLNTTHLAIGGVAGLAAAVLYDKQIRNMTPSSPMVGSVEQLAPAAAAGVSFLALRKKHRSAAIGAAAGLLAGLAYSFYDRSTVNRRSISDEVQATFRGLSDSTATSPGTNPAALVSPAGLALLAAPAGLAILAA